MSISYFLHPTTKLAEELSRSSDVSYRDGCIRYPTPPEEKMSPKPVFQVSPHDIIQTLNSSDRTEKYISLSISSSPNQYAESPWKANFINYQSSETLTSDVDNDTVDSDVVEVATVLEKESESDPNEQNKKEKIEEDDQMNHSPPNQELSNAHTNDDENWLPLSPCTSSKESNSDDTWHTSTGHLSEPDSLSPKSNSTKRIIKHEKSCSSLSEISSQSFNSSRSDSSHSASSSSYQTKDPGDNAERRRSKPQSKLFFLARKRFNRKTNNDLENGLPSYSALPANDGLPRKRDKFKILTVLLWKRYFSFSSRSQRHLSKGDPKF